MLLHFIEDPFFKLITFRAALAGVVAFAASVVLGPRVIRFLRERKIGAGALLAWGALWIAVTVIAVQPELASRTADLLGIGRGADVVVYSAIVALLALVFRLSVRIEQLDRDITRVTRELALRKPSEEDGE